MSRLTKKSDTHQERYVHLVLEGHPKVHAATVFAREYQPGAWGYAVSFCAHGDQFVRRIGRQVARRRYFLGPEHRWHVDGPFEFQKCVDQALARAAEL